jgi:hypothetical protein
MGIEWSRLGNNIKFGVGENSFGGVHLFHLDMDK